MSTVINALRKLEARMRDNVGQLLGDGAAGREFDRLYNVWIRARWDAGDAWVRSVWPVRQ